MSNLVDHAKRELSLVREDAKIVDSTLKIVEEFAKVGHSGASAEMHIALLDRVLRFENLAPLGISEDEWVAVADGLWQNARNGEAFSEDFGRTYYLLSERKRRHWPLHGWSKPLHAAH